MKPVKVGHTYYPSHLPQGVSKTKQKLAQTKPFVEHLQHKLQTPTTENTTLKFSQHAKDRLMTRGIDVDEELMRRLNHAYQKAQEKGAKESLFLTDGLAFVVSIKNQTIITAMDQDMMEEQVITNIDSAVLVGP